MPQEGAGELAKEVDLATRCDSNRAKVACFETVADEAEGGLGHGHSIFAKGLGTGGVDVGFEYAMFDEILYQPRRYSGGLGEFVLVESDG